MSLEAPLVKALVDFGFDRESVEIRLLQYSEDQGRAPEKFGASNQEVNDFVAYFCACQDDSPAALKSSSDATSSVNDSGDDGSRSSSRNEDESSPTRMQAGDDEAGSAHSTEADSIEEDSEPEILRPATGKKRQSLDVASTSSLAAQPAEQILGQRAERQGDITKFLTRLPAGTPTSEAATPPATQPFCQQQLTTSMADSGSRLVSSGIKMRHPKFPSSNIWHPGSQEERAMDDLDYANWMVFGNRSFRLDQHNIIKAALQGQDLFVLMPTGGGKSLCYQLSAILSRGITVVVSPLLSLMQDQVRALCHLPSGGIPATYLSSQQSRQEVNRVYAALNEAVPIVKLLYVTPEQLDSSERLGNTLEGLCRRDMVSRFVVDEAHCCSSYGHDFRPAYKELGSVRESYMRGVPTMAVTATATDAVKADVLKMLKIPRARTFKVSFLRKNLTFRVEPKSYDLTEEGQPAHMERLVDYIRTWGPGVCGIVYCLSRDNTEQVAYYLNEFGQIPASHYHARMTPGQRVKVQNDWQSGKLQIAFGMGVDKPNVRFVVHFTLSKCIEPRPSKQGVIPEGDGPSHRDERIL
ncbi:hypothetical protein WJX84_001189 [Apatococcus fuscideae]|uniref:DNA 3'-5' helicase n=1 Tax=Apatococcus fuscideae TaxID=2026836 RepID=A0AAW1SWW1_9CHLO